MRVALRWTASLVLVVAAAIPMLPQLPSPEGIPFHFGGSFRVILIQGEVNGNRTSFIVDTGSNRTIISSKFVPMSSLNLKDRAEPAAGSGYAGRGAYANASLKIGQQAWGNRQLLVVDLQDVSQSMGEEVGGLLGMDFLNEFEMVVVDIRHHELILR